MPLLSLKFLGTFQVILDQQPVSHFRSANVQGLLAYLALQAKRPFPRETLAALFWPEATDSIARQNLRQSLYQLRKILDTSSREQLFLHVTRQTIQFNSESEHSLDVRQFLDALDDGDWETAVSLYTGDLLPGFTCDSPEFEEWLRGEQERLHHLGLKTMAQLADRYLRNGRIEAAQTVARRQLALEAWSETAHRQLMEALALTGHRAAALAQFEQCRQILAAELGVAPAPETVALAEHIENNELHPIALRPSDAPRVDWGEMPHLDVFHGREEERSIVTGWLTADRCHVVTILGMGGQGKTSLAAQIVRALAAETSESAFECIIWRSLLNAPPLSDLLQTWLPFLSDQAITELPSGLDVRLTLLLDQLRRQRCLLILDNVESILQSGREGEPAGAYWPGYADYGQLIQRIGHGNHQSCLLLTSRERPSEITRLEWDTKLVRSLQLTGLDDAAGQAILQEQGLTTKANLAQLVVQRYSGNPLALKLIVETVQDFYAGNITAFLDEGTPIFDDIQDVLDQQFARLGELEQTILFWLAIARQAVSLPTLHNVMWNPVPQRTLLVAMRSLQRRSLLEKSEAGFTLQNVVSEYITNRLIEIICQEIASKKPQRLASHALLNAQVEAHIRHSQARLILKPIAARLTTRWRSLDLATHMCALLDHLRSQPRFVRSYAAGNLLNLLLQTGITAIRGHDFSHLSVWQAHLRGMEAKDVNFDHADLTGAAFTDTFGFINQVAYSADGRLLAAGTGDKEVILWQTHDNQPYGLLRGHASFVEAIAFAPHDDILASGGTDGTMRLWDARSGECLRILSGHTRGIYGLAFSPDGRIVASASEDQTVRLWQVSDGECLHVLHGHTHRVNAIAWSSDGVTLASASEDQTVRLWHLPDGECRNVLCGHTAAVTSLAFSPDGKMLISGGRDCSLHLWDVRSGEMQRSFLGHNEQVRTVAFSPDGQKIASASEGQIVRLWDVDTGETTAVLHGHTELVNSVTFSPDGQTLASGSNDSTVRLWDVNRGVLRQTLRGHVDWVWDIALSQDGAMMASVGEDKMVNLWQLANRKIQSQFKGHTQRIYAVTFSPNGRWLASAGSDRAVRIWRTRSSSSEPPYVVLDGSRGFTDVSFSADDQLLAASSHDRYVYVWDVATWQRRHRLQGHTTWVEAVAFSPQGNLLASGSHDQTIRLWEAVSGEHLHTLEGHNEAVSALTFRADGLLLASGSWDGTVRLWDVAANQPVRVLSGHENWIWGVAFSPDGSLLASASADHSVRLWDVERGESQRILNGHEDTVFSVAFSVDGDTLFSSSADSTIKLWDVQTGRCLDTLRIEGPYAGMDITAVTGITNAQKVALRALGAIER